MTRSHKAHRGLLDASQDQVCVISVSRSGRKGDTVMKCVALIINKR